MTRLREFLIPLPPLEEQKRIVAKVDELMGLIDRLEAQQRAKHEARLSFGSAALGSLLGAEDAGTFAGHWRRVRDSFDLLCSTPENVAALRKAVLQLAVQGKLVPQDPEDEPAEWLLERVNAEKAQLVEEGAIKKTKKRQLVGELPFEIPNCWQWVRLQEVFNIITDGDHQPPPKSTSGIPFLVIGNVRSGILNFTDTRFVTEDYYSTVDESRKPRKGDLLYTVVGSYGIPVVVDTDTPFCVQRHIAILKPSQNLSVDFLSYAMSSTLVFNQATECATGIAQKTVTLGGLRQILIPLPPLNEQKRIVAKVDELMGLVDGLEGGLTQARGDAERLLAAVVHRLQAA